MKKAFYAIMILAIFLSGCAKESSTSNEREPGIADYITGAEDIRTYRRTKTKIEEIGKTLKDRGEQSK